MNRVRILGALVALAGVISACGNSDADKAGGEGEADSVVLTLANPDDGPFNLDEYAREVESRSDGSVRIEFRNNWRPGEVDTEQGTIEDVREGKVDLGSVGARAFDLVGVDSFQPLVAPSAVLHTAEPNGSDVERLSPPGIDGAFEDYHARFSADGSYLVFIRIRNVDLHVAVFRMDADGTDVRRLTPWRLDADLADLSLAASGPTEDRVVFETYGMGAPKGKSQDLATVPATCPSPPIAASGSTT